MNRNEGYTDVHIDGVSVDAYIGDEFVTPAQVDAQPMPVASLTNVVAQFIRPVELTGALRATAFEVVVNVVELG